MKTNSELFDLIKSLNKTEKRYFKVFTSKHRENKKYMILFNELDKLTNYNETEFKNRLTDKKLKKHYAFNKLYLRNLILKALRLYYSISSYDIRIQDAISSARILSRKALYGQYFKMIKFAKQLAIRRERFGYLLEILEMEKIVIKKEELQTNKMRDLYEQVSEALKIIGNIFKYSKIISMLLSYYRDTGIRREEKHEKKLQQLLASPILKSQILALSNKAKENFFRIWQLIGEARGNYEGVYENLKKRMDIINENPDMFKETIIDLRIDALVDMLNTCMQLNKFKDYEKYLNRIKSIDIEIESERIDLDITLTLSRFKLLLFNKNYKEAYNYIANVEQLLHKYKNKIMIDSELTLRFNIVKTLILSKKYDQGLSSINKLLVHPLINKRKDYRFYLRILNLIIHFELKNYGLLNYLIRSTYRSLTKTKRLYKTEGLILKFLKKLPELKDKKNLLEHLEDFRSKLKELKKLTYEKNAFEYFDFLDWVEAKINEAAPK